MSAPVLFNRILVPVDGSDIAARAARFALRLAMKQPCEIVALHVIDEDIVADMARYTDQPPALLLKKMERCGNSYLEDIQALAPGPKGPIVGELRVGTPHREILSMAADGAFDLIVMGTVGRRGTRRVLLGSVTERVIEYSKVPVLVVK